MKVEARKFLMDVMCDAYEHSISYWVMRARNVQRDPGFNYLSYEVQTEDSIKWYLISPETLDPAIRRILDGSVQIRRDIAAQFVGYPNDVENCHYDGEGADCAVQIACFGEIVYG